MQSATQYITFQKIRVRRPDEFQNFELQLPSVQEALKECGALAQKPIKNKNFSLKNWAAWEWEWVVVDPGGFMSAFAHLKIVKQVAIHGHLSIQSWLNWRSQGCLLRVRPIWLLRWIQKWSFSICIKTTNKNNTDVWKSGPKNKVHYSSWEYIYIF